MHKKGTTIIKTKEKTVLHLGNLDHGISDNNPPFSSQQHT
jgi:hypothetical protein